VTVAALALQRGDRMRSQRPRLDPASYVGLQRYFLTFCTYGRRRLFVTREAVDLVLDQILRTACEFDFNVNVHCFMPDHVHLLTEGRAEQADAARFVHQAKQRSGYVFAQRYRTRLWQPSFYDHVLRDDEAALSVAHYIIENPVRAGLVESPIDYPFLGTSEYTIGQILDAVCWQP
jgi:putative transposase